MKDLLKIDSIYPREGRLCLPKMEICNTYLCVLAQGMSKIFPEICSRQLERCFVIFKMSLMVCYYRYLRFYPSGRFLYKVEAALLYPGLRPTVLRIHLRLRGTTLGANNRMDLLSLVTCGVNDAEASGPDEAILGVVEGWKEDETHNLYVPAISHRRGISTLDFDGWMDQ